MLEDQQSDEQSRADPVQRATPVIQSGDDDRVNADQVQQNADQDASPYAETRRDRVQRMTAVELDVLQGVDHVEPAAPGDDQSGQQDGEDGYFARYRDVSAHRSDSERDAQHDVTPGRKTFCKTVSDQHQQCCRREEKSQPVDPQRDGQEQRRVDDHEDQRPARGDHARRDLPVAGARVQRVDPPVGIPVESHRRVAGEHHCQQYLYEQQQRKFRIGRLQRIGVADQRERHGENRMAELDHRGVSGNGLRTNHKGVFFRIRKNN